MGDALEQLKLEGWLVEKDTNRLHLGVQNCALLVLRKVFETKQIETNHHMS